MRKHQLIALSIMLSLAFATPAAAQSNAASAQYEPGVTCVANESNIVCTQSIEDGFKAMTEDSAKKAEAAGAVLSGDAPDAGNTPGTGSDADTGDAPGSEDGAPDAKNPANARAADTIELPDTGGAPLAALGAGVLLAGGGMLLRSKTPR